jgi:hypothetical protein
MQFKKLTSDDIINLGVFLAVIIIRIGLNYFSIPARDSGLDRIIYEIVIDFVCLFVVATSPFCIRFRNLSFVVSWVLLSVMFSLTDFRPITSTPLVLFFLYCIIRLLFWKIYNREFIPCTLSKSNSYGYYSALDNRTSGKEDAIFMRIYFFAGFLSLIASIFLSGR